MNYNETLNYLYNQLPMFERQGGDAYKPGLATSQALDDWCGNPHRRYRVIHVAGTNGKGSTCHMLAAALQQAGYTVGLYTSPHLVDFRERIRVNGQMISKQAVMGFVRRYLDSDLDCRPSFFELTTAMALDYFARRHVDLAVVEAGLGGRLDSTNIVTPMVSVITNISLDHTEFLGDTLPQIAREKAGIIKPQVPVVIGESGDDEVRAVFDVQARAMHAPIVHAQDRRQVLSATPAMEVSTAGYGVIMSDLKGLYQQKNINTVLVVLDELRKLGVHVEARSVKQALEHVSELNGIEARWTVVDGHPTIIYDSGHNVGGWREISRQLQNVRCRTLRMVVGFVGDKDVDSILAMAPEQACYYFTQPQSRRALAAADLCAKAAVHGLRGERYDLSRDAIAQALRDADGDDVVFVGGSNYLLGDVIPLLPKPGAAGVTHP